MKNEIKSQNINTQYNSIIKNYTNRIIAEVDSFYNIQAPQIPLWEIHNILWEKLSDLDAYFDTLFSLIFSNDMDGEIMKENKYLSYYANIFGYYFLVLFHKDIGKLIPKDLVHEIGFKYFYLLYKQWASLNSFKKQQNKLTFTNTKIQTLLAWRWFQIDIEYISQQKICEFITFLEHSLILPEEKEFYTAIVYYLCNLLIVHNLLWSQHHLSTLDDIPKNPHNNPWSQLYFFSLSLIAQADFILQHEWDYTFWNQIARLHSIVWNNVSLWHLKKIQKSFLYQNYFLPWLIKNESLFQLAIQHEKLFVHEKHIPYQKLFDRLNIISDTRRIKKIGLFLEISKKYKCSEDSLIDIVNTVLKYNRKIDTWDIELILSFISLWWKIEFLFRIWFDTLRELKTYPFQKQKELFEQLTINPNYFVHLKKIKIIDEFKEELSFLHEYEEWKMKWIEIINNISKYSVDDLKLNILTIKIYYNLDEKMKWNKKIFHNNQENIWEKLLLLDIGMNYFQDFDNKEDILIFIFSYTLEEINIILDISAKIDFWKQINIKNFSSLIYLFLSKRTYMKNLNTEEKISVENISKILDSKTLQENIYTQLKHIYKKDLYEIIIDLEWWSVEKWEIEKISLIIDIWKKIDENFKEDFILHIENLSNEDLKNTYEIITLFKFYKINILFFSEYLDINKKYFFLSPLKNILTNEVLNNINQKIELKKIIYEYLNSWNIQIVEKFISNIWNKTTTLSSKNEYDQNIIDIYLHGNSQEKDMLIKKITIFLTKFIADLHPIHTTSTRNMSFWPGSGTYTYVILNYILKKLVKNENESHNEYLQKILSLNVIDIINIQNISHVNWNHELKCLYKACCEEETLKNIPLITFLENIEIMIGKIYWEMFLDLSTLQKFYSWLLKDSLKKMKINFKNEV